MVHRLNRFYFHLTHSEDIRDDKGVELASAHDAKCHAVKMIADLLCKTPEKFWETETFRVTVSDAEGLLLLNVEMIATLAPALYPAKPKRP
jgi:uncharacterized protein DUF6894